MADPRNSNDPYRSAGKTFNRNTISRETATLAREVNRPLDAIWLSSDEFIDLQDIYPMFREIWVPENAPKSLRNKLQFISHAPRDCADVVKVPARVTDMLQLVQEMFVLGRRFDIINLDFCTHLNGKIENTLSAILRGRLLRSGGRLFLTVARITQANKNPKLEHKVLATTIDRVGEQLEAEIVKDHVKLTLLPGYPYSYNGRNSVRCPMFSFGWRLGSYLGERASSKASRSSADVSSREKHAIVCLRLAKIPVKTIAGAFGVSTGTTAAYQAWYTMRAQKAGNPGAEPASNLPFGRDGSQFAEQERPDALRGSDLLSAREQHAIVCLRLAEVSAALIALAFAVSPGTVTAVMKRFTNSAKKGDLTAQAS